MASQGIGPITSAPLLERMAAVLPKVDMIMLREAVLGADILRAVGIDDDRFSVVGDDAIMLSGAADPIADRDRIGLSLRSAPYLSIDEWNDTIASAIAIAAARLSATVRPVASCEWGDDDRRINGLVASQAGKSDRDLARSDGPEQFAQAFRACRVVVTTLYHAAVFALAHGSPAVCIYVTPYQRSKYLGLASLYGPGGLTLVDASAGCDRDTLVDAIVNAWESAAELHTSLLATTSEIRSRIVDVYDDLGALVAKKRGTAYPVPRDDRVDRFASVPPRS